MSLRIESEHAGGVAVLRCAGRIVRAESLRRLQDAVTSLVRTRIIVLDLSGVETLDGGGLGMLVFLHCWTRDHDIQMKLVNPSNFTREVLERTGLTCVLHISAVEDAVELLCNANHLTPNHLSANVLSRGVVDSTHPRLLEG